RSRNCGRSACRLEYERSARSACPRRSRRAGPHRRIHGRRMCSCPLSFTLRQRDRVGRALENAQDGASLAAIGQRRTLSGQAGQEMRAFALERLLIGDVDEPHRATPRHGYAMLQLDEMLVYPKLAAPFRLTVLEDNRCVVANRDELLHLL